MDRMDHLFQRLVADPRDAEALSLAFQAGSADPLAYARLLEKVGEATADPHVAAHWLAQASGVYTAVNDAHHAERTLQRAVERDPSQGELAERLAALYRDRGDAHALVQLHHARASALTPRAGDPHVRAELAVLHGEIVRLCKEPPIGRPEAAVASYRALVELDPTNVYAVYEARELLKQQGQFAEAVPFFALELALVEDPERRLALLRDEADVRQRADDLAGAAEALRQARALTPDDVNLAHELATLLLKRITAGGASEGDRAEAADLFRTLAELYEKEYAYSFATSALVAQPGHDRAMQLADYWGQQLGKQAELAPLYAAYLASNPSGYMADELRARMPTAPSRPPLPLPLPLARPADAPVAPPALGAAPLAGATGDVEPSRGALPTLPSAEEKPVARGGDVAALLGEARAEAQRARKPQALAKFREVLAIEPAHAEALAWVEEHLRQRRQFADLRDVLLAAAQVPSAPLDARKAQLREVAGLCESQLRDLDTAAQAWKLLSQADRGDESSREQLRRILEKAAKWDELATALEQDAMSVPDVEQRIALERKLAGLHESKRKDLAAAGEAWSRIAGLTPGDDAAVQSAVKLFERAERPELAAQVILENLPGIEDKSTRADLLGKLGALRSALGDASGAADALQETAEILGTAKAWAAAEQAFLTAERWSDAAFAIERRAELEGGRGEGELLARSADLLVRSGDPAGAIERLTAASKKDPSNDIFFTKLEELLLREQREGDLIAVLVERASQLTDGQKRSASRRRAAALQSQAGDREGARDTLLALLQDGEDAEALTQLADDAEDRGDFQELADLLRRLQAVTAAPSERLSLALREAAVFADKLDDVGMAVERYEAIVKDLEPGCREALRAIADLEERRDGFAASANALERELVLTEGAERGELAQRLAKLYEGALDEPTQAARCLEVVRELDPEDFDAIARLFQLAERLGDWSKAATYLEALIEVEGDDDEAARMTLQLAELLAERLGRGPDALAALGKLADGGNAACREAFVTLGDKLGAKALVASKLVAWNETAPPYVRTEAMRGALDRYLEVGSDNEACAVAVEMSRSRSADKALGTTLEAIATRVRNLDALQAAHELLVKDLSGAPRAEELVRQAEMLSRAGVDPLEAIQHGELGLANVPPGQVEELLARLAGLTNAPGHAIDVYERQIGRCKAPADRLAALARAAQVAATRGALDRARGFYEIALGSGVNDEAIGALVQSARAADSEAGQASGSLRALLAQTLAAGGHGSRDGGRTRSALLRRAASLAFDDLGDAQQAFAWLADALVAHVDDASLDVLAELGARVGDPRRVEAALSKALEEVFDGPLVRKLLQRRARVRRDALGDERGAATDLKKLRELAPNDADVTQELTALLDALQDHRGRIQLLEDQILRGRDPAARAELARKVAHLWEQELGDAREAGDAWRRVLRMKPNDPDATAGLERAKSGQLRRADARPPRADKPAVLAAASPEPAPFATVSPEPAAAEGPTSPPQAPADVDGPTADGTTDAPFAAEPVAPTEPARLDVTTGSEPSAAAPTADEGAWGQALPAQPHAVEGYLVEGHAAQGYAQPAPEAYAAHEAQAFPAQGHPSEPQQAPYGAEASHEAPPDLQPQPIPYPEFPPHLQPQWDAATQQYVYPPGYAEAYALYYEQLAAYQAQYGHVAPAEPAAEAAASEAAPESVDEADLVEDAEILDDDDQS